MLAIARPDEIEFSTSCNCNASGWLANRLGRRNRLKVGSGFGIAVNGVAWRSMAVLDVRVDSDILVQDVGPDPGYAVFEVRSGVHRTDRELTSGAVALTRGYRRLEARDLDVRIARVSAETMADALIGVGAEEVHFLDVEPRDAARADLWRRTVDYVQSLPEDADAAQSPLIVQAAAEALATAMLDVFRNDLRAVAQSSERSPTATRKALEYIHANLGEPIRILDVAAAAHVGPAALRQMFERSFDTSVHGYIREARLEAAHAELLDSGPDTSIAAIARRWGFVHMGRFTAQYRLRYGCPPGRTLDRIR